jgi:phosphoenolpyruvate synthase/pyruvate phosphate dikinase
MNDRAIAYRKMNDIPASWGTAVNIQAMVFGNMGTDSGSGVAFTRDAATGENVFYGEYLINAQGEDVVSGARTPEPIAQLAKENPKIYNQAGEGSKDFGEALPRHVGCGVHHPTGKALHVAMSSRQANCLRRD